MLLSQACQSHLGFTKSARNGTISLDDHDGQQLEVARQARTGLFMVRIDHLLRRDFLESMKAGNLPPETTGLFLDEPDVVCSSDEEDDYEKFGYVADAGRDKRTKSFDEEFLAAQTIIVSCGMANFEAGAYANGSSTTFRDYQGGRKITTSHFERFPQARVKFINSFRRNYPDLVKGRHIIVIDCTTFPDPGQDRGL